MTPRCTPARRRPHRRPGSGPAPASLAAAGLVLGGAISLPQPAPAATPAEVCQSDTTPADATFTCGNPGTGTVFWTPRCSTGNLTGRPPAGNLTFALLNTNSARVLTATGTTAADILVGSPGTSDVLSGSAGRNTYVMGGQNGYVLGAGDRAIPVNTSGESDWANLSPASPEYIHINAAGQGNPGLIVTAMSAPASVSVRGSNELAGFAFSPCPGVSPKLLRAPAPATPTLAQSGPAILGGPQQSGSPVRLQPGRSDPAATTGPTLAAGGLPGSPTLRGFSLEVMDGDRDRILLPADRYRFLGESLVGRQEIPVLVVTGVRFDPPRPVSEAALRQLRSRSPGLARVRSDVAPLVYFADNGLLVFSSNGAPLGSAANPGLVIARLLDEGDRPLVLPVSGPAPLYPARFVVFTAPQRTQAPGR